MKKNIDAPSCGTMNYLAMQSVNYVHQRTGEGVERGLCGVAGCWGGGYYDNLSKSQERDNAIARLKHELVVIGRGIAACDHPGNERHQGLRTKENNLEKRIQELENEKTEELRRRS